MTDEQINAAIADATGWTAIWGEGCDPDYCGDLNEMHEAEKTLSHRDEGMYFLTLKQIVGDLIWYRDTCRNYRATARERAEAFLRTLGKWKEATDKDFLTVGGATAEESSADHVGNVTEMMEEVQDAPQ